MDNNTYDDYGLYEPTMEDPYVREPIPDKSDQLIETTIMASTPTDSVTKQTDSVAEDEGQVIYMYQCLTCNRTNVQIANDIRLQHTTPQHLCHRCQHEPVCIQLPLCGCHQLCFYCYKKHSKRPRISSEQWQLLLQLCIY
jgi:hypothetical protein